MISVQRRLNARRQPALWTTQRHKNIAVSADPILAEGHDNPLPQMDDDDLDQAVDEGENADLSTAEDQLLRLSQ